MASHEYTVRASREDIDSAIQAGYTRAQNNFERAIDLAGNAYWAWGENASLSSYASSNPLLHQLTGELPLGATNYRDEEYNRCNDSISKELYDDFNQRVYIKTQEYIDQALTANTREERLIKLDYAKQYALTMFHAAQYPMRTDFLEDTEIQPIDYAGLAARHATRAFYLDILGHDTYAIHSELESAKNYLNEPSVEAVIVSADKKSFKMQELDQPLTILASSLLAVSDHPNTELIYALPAGGTQHGIVTQLLYELKNRNRDTPSLDYLPISTHSTGKKALQGDVSPSIDAIVQRTNPTGKNVIICEDNSNTGTTLSLASDVISASSPASLHVSIVEFDPRRLEVKNRHPEPVTT